MKPWPLFLTHKVSSSREVNASIEHALNLTQDPKTLIESNPLVVGFKEDASTGWHTITDKTSILGFSYTFDYRAKFNIEEDGMTSFVEAGAGVTIRGRWKAEVMDDGDGQKKVVKVTNEDVVTVPFILSPFVMKNLRSAHSDLLDRLVEILTKNASTSS